MSSFRIPKRLVYLSVGLCIAACSNRETVFIPAPLPDDEASVVYIYRPSSTTNFMLSPMLLVDGNEKFSIASGDHRYIVLPAGDHSLGLNPTDQYTTGAALALAVDANSRYYVRISTSLAFVPDGMNTRRFWLQPVEEPQALEEIAATEYAGPLQQPMAEQPDDSAASEGFTIDRARHPFPARD